MKRGFPTFSPTSPEGSWKSQAWREVCDDPTVQEGCGERGREVFEWHCCGIAFGAFSGFGFLSRTWKSSLNLALTWEAANTPHGASVWKVIAFGTGQTCFSVCDGGHRCRVLPAKLLGGHAGRHGSAVAWGSRSEHGGCGGNVPCRKLILVPFPALTKKTQGPSEWYPNLRKKGNSSDVFIADWHVMWASIITLDSGERRVVWFRLSASVTGPKYTAGAACTSQLRTTRVWWPIRTDGFQSWFHLYFLAGSDSYPKFFMVLLSPFIVGCILVYFRSSFTSAFNWRPTLPTFNPLYFHFLMVDMLICWWLISEGLASAGRSCSCFRIEYSRVWNHALFETFTWSRGPWALNDICTRP